MWLLSEHVRQPMGKRVFGVFSQGNITDRAVTFWLINRTSILWAMTAEKWMFLMRTFDGEQQCWWWWKPFWQRPWFCWRCQHFHAALNWIYWIIKASIFYGNSWTHPQFIAWKWTIGLLQYYSQIQILGITGNQFTFIQNQLVILDF